MSNTRLHNFNLDDLTWSVQRRNRADEREPSPPKASAQMSPAGHQPKPSTPMQPPPSSALSKKEASIASSLKKGDQKLKEKNRAPQEKLVKIQVQKDYQPPKEPKLELGKPLKMKDNESSTSIVDGEGIKSKDKQKVADPIEELTKLKWPSFSLTPEEIAEDIYGMTGKKPLRGRLKRSKVLQEKIDKLFPMVSEAVFNPKLYEADEDPPKLKDQNRRL